MICGVCGRNSARDTCVRCRIGSGVAITVRPHTRADDSASRRFDLDWREAEVRRYFRMLNVVGAHPGMSITIRPGMRRDYAVIKRHIQLAARRLHWRIIWPHKRGGLTGVVAFDTTPTPAGVTIPNWYAR